MGIKISYLNVRGLDYSLFEPSVKRSKGSIHATLNTVMLVQITNYKEIFSGVRRGVLQKQAEGEE